MSGGRGACGVWAVRGVGVGPGMRGGGAGGEGGVWGERVRGVGVQAAGAEGVLWVGV